MDMQTMLNEDLLTAIQRGYFDMVKSLISQGADPHKKNRVLGGGEISAITFARYMVKNERLADFLEYY